MPVADGLPAIAIPPPRWLQPVGDGLREAFEAGCEKRELAGSKASAPFARRSAGGMAGAARHIASMRARGRWRWSESARKCHRALAGGTFADAVCTLRSIRFAGTGGYGGPAVDRLAAAASRVLDPTRRSTRHSDRGQFGDVQRSAKRDCDRRPTLRRKPPRRRSDEDPRRVLGSCLTLRRHEPASQIAMARSTARAPLTPKARHRARRHGPGQTLKLMHDRTEDCHCGPPHPPPGSSRGSATAFTSYRGRLVSARPTAARQSLHPIPGRCRVPNPTTAGGHPERSPILSGRSPFIPAAASPAAGARHDGDPRSDGVGKTFRAGGAPSSPRRRVVVLRLRRCHAIVGSPARQTTLGNGPPALSATAGRSVSACCRGAPQLTRAMQLVSRTASALTRAAARGERQAAARVIGSARRSAPGRSSSSTGRAGPTRSALAARSLRRRASARHARRGRTS